MCQIHSWRNFGFGFHPHSLGSPTFQHSFNPTKVLKFLGLPATQISKSTVSLLTLRNFKMSINWIATVDFQDVLNRHLMSAQFNFSDSKLLTCGQALKAITKSTSAFKEIYCPSLLVGGSNESVVWSSCTGIFMNRFNGEGVNCGALIPIQCSQLTTNPQLVSPSQLSPPQDNTQDEILTKRTITYQSPSIPPPNYQHNSYAHSHLPTPHISACHKPQSTCHESPPSYPPQPWIISYAHCYTIHPPLLESPCSDWLLCVALTTELLSLKKGKEWRRRYRRLGFRTCWLFLLLGRLSVGWRCRGGREWLWEAC